MEAMNDLKALLKHEIQDLYSAEEQILEAMPMMIEKAMNPNLKKALKEHLKITERQKKRLDKIQKMMNSKKEQQEGGEEKKGLFASLFGSITGDQKCKGMEGLITEGQKVMKEDMSPEVLDAAIIACSQKIEHYEICGYGTAKAYARELELNAVADLLDETLNEEYDADTRLTELAVSVINKKAEGEAPKAAKKVSGGSSAGEQKGGSKQANIKSEGTKAQQSKGANGNANAAPKKAAGKQATRATDEGQKGKAVAAKKTAAKKANAKAAAKK